MLFYLYLGIVSLLLLIFAVFVSMQLKFIVLYCITLLKILKINKSSLSFSFNDYQDLSYFYLNVSNYFLSFSLCEFYLECTSDSIYEKNLYASLALVYRELSFIQISEYYYFKAIACDPDDAQLSMSLGQMYSQLGYSEDSKIFYQNSISIK